LIVGYAFTDYKAQGQTLEHVIVDLTKPPRGSITPFGAYVALSHSRGRDTIRLLREFNNTLLTMHPLQMLYEEDQRLRRLAAEAENQKI
jgi:ATP-dependent exoDNAse (exonuclease V) alpha subunit